MGAALWNKIMGDGPLVEVDNSFQCCNDDVHSSSSSDTHTSRHTGTRCGQSSDCITKNGDTLKCG